MYEGEIKTKRVYNPSRENDGLIFVLSGEAVYRFADKQFKAETGDIFYLSHKSQYEITDIEFPYIHYCINFLFDRDEDISLECEVFKLKNPQKAKALFVKALELWKNPNTASKILCKAVLLEIYSSLVKNTLEAYMPSTKLKQMQDIILKIEENYGNPDLSVFALAEMYGCSEAHFRRTFQQIYKLSPQKYITELRLNKAKTLLSDTDTPINKIALACGFASTYYFDRVFKASNTITPLQYRKRYK